MAHNCALEICPCTIIWGILKIFFLRVLIRFGSVSVSHTRPITICNKACHLRRIGWWSVWWIFSNKLTITEKQWFNNIHHELCNVYPFVNIFPVLGFWIEKRALFWSIKQLDLEFCVKKIKIHKFFVRHLTSSRIYLVSAKYSYGVWRVGCNILWVSIQRRFGMSCICRVYFLRKSTYFHVMWTLLESISRFMGISVIADFRWYV